VTDTHAARAAVRTAEALGCLGLIPATSSPLAKRFRAELLPLPLPALGGCRPDLSALYSSGRLNWRKKWRSIEPAVPFARDHG
jgi:hypothetical protein